VLRTVLAVLHERAGFERAAIVFVRGGGLALGPEAGKGASFPVRFCGDLVAELEVAPATAGSEAFLERVALLIGPNCVAVADSE
jgi:hypothetical protein